MPERKASDYLCVDCNKNQAVCFWPILDIDIPSSPYCRKCVEIAKVELLIKLYQADKEHEFKQD